jgi:ABC-2 type transport system permease protein
MKSNFANSLKLTKFMLRRERVVSSVWIIAIVLFTAGFVPVLYGALVADGFDALSGMMNSPAMVSMMGPAYVLVNETFGALYTNMMMLWLMIAVALMNVFLVVRLSRADEEMGRLEVLRSLPVGRLANLTAVMVTALLVNILLAVIVGLGMFALAADASMCFNGSMLWGATLGVTGIVFAAITALFAQLSPSARGVMGYSFAAMGVFYIMRAMGDMTAEMEIVSLISPLGLALRTQAYAGNYWWPVFALLGLAAAALAAAYYFNAIRDIEQGIIPAKAGRAHGSFLMRSPFGLSFKLLRTSLIVWTLGMLILGVAYGTVLGEVDEFIATNDVWQQMMLGPAGVEFVTEAGLTQEQIVAILRSAVAEAGYTMPGLFMSAIINIIGIFALVPPLIFMLKAKAEERDIRAELVLAAPVHRWKYFAGYAVIAFASAVLIQGVLALGLYSIGAAVLENPSDLPLRFLLEANLSFVPAQWVMVGIAAFIIGFLPKATGIVWGYFGFSFLIMFIGRMGVFPDWIGNLTPFGFVPQLPMETINFTVLAVLVLIAAGFTAAGFYGYRDRDINAVTN